MAKFKRFLANERVSQQTFWLPLARQLIAAVSRGRPELVIALDGSTLGQGCVALVASLAYAGRSLPIAWLVVKGKKGHLAQARHLELVEQLAALFDGDTKIVLLGDGEFDGTQLLARFDALGWRYVVRTAKNSLVYDQDLTLRFMELGVGPGGLVGIAQAHFTQARYGPVLAVAVWEARFDEPLYLVSNLACPYLARDYYARRGRIECCFSDRHAPRFPSGQKPFGRPGSAQSLNVSSGVGRVVVDLPGCSRARTRLGLPRSSHRADGSELFHFRLAHPGRVFNVRAGRALWT